MMATRLRLLVIALAGTVLAGCKSPIQSERGGILTVNIDEQVSRNLVPSISMDPTSYVVEGSGPDDAGFSQTISGGNVTVNKLAFGEWTVSVTAKNADGAAIGAGSRSVTVLSDSAVSLTITVMPYEGFGTLTLNLSWPADQVQTAQVTSTLTPYQGAVRTLPFSVNSAGGTADFSADDVAAGYHTLTLKNG